MTELPQYVIVSSSSAHWEIVRLSSSGDFYVLLSTCKSFSDAEHVLRGMNSSRKKHDQEIDPSDPAYGCDWREDSYGALQCGACGRHEGQWTGDPCATKASRVWVPLGSA